METKPKTDKRKVLLVLPILVLTFLALTFYAMGGGKGQHPFAQQSGQKGINTSLPNAAISKDAPQDKYGVYQQTDRDSAGKHGNSIKDVADRLGFNGQEEDPQTKQINEKLKALNKEIAKPAEPAVNRSSPVQNNQPSSIKSDVDRLEALMKTMKKDKGDDPEMAQLSGMMDKIIAIQNPNIVQEKLKTELPPIKPDSAFKAIPAVIEGSQKVAQGAVVKLRLLDTIHLKDMVIPKDQLLFGSCNITNQRLLLNIKNIRLGSSIIPVDLSVFSLDGLIGINAPEAELNEAAGNGATGALQGMQFLSMDQSIGVQAAGAGIEAAKGLLSKKVKRIRVKLKGGQTVLLRNNEPHSLTH